MRFPVVVYNEKCKTITRTCLSLLTTKLQILIPKLYRSLWTRFNSSENSYIVHGFLIFTQVFWVYVENIAFSSVKCSYRQSPETSKLPANVQEVLKEIYLNIDLYFYHRETFSHQG